MLLWYWRDPPPEPRVPFELELLHRDAHLVVVDKPHFLPVIPGGRHLVETVLVRLRQALAIDTLAPMHRLDRDTAGVLAFTVQPATRHAYQSLLRDRQVHKVYEAIAPWRADLALPVVCRHRLAPQAGEAFMQMQVVPGEPNAETLVELIERIEPSGLAHYRLTPHTGRKHQLRAQMSAQGLPIVGDRIYPRLLPQPAPDAAPDYAQPLQLLARELAFTDPLSGEPRRFTSRRRLALAPSTSDAAATAGLPR
jgi:tRNA pseudouridine32 synthase/23S rRNA pseudouridine746 synthase